MRLRIDLAYDGSQFSGWAAQPGLRTVEHELSAGIARVLRLDPAPALVVAGRTDAGVHATGQVCHLDLPDDFTVDLRDRTDADPAEVLAHRLRRVLPDDLAVHGVQRVSADFDARFSAMFRRYTYRIWDEQSFREPTLRHRVAVVRGVVDVAAMNSSAEVLLGLHDFAAFCKPREGATTIRTLQRFECVREEAGTTGAGTIVATVVADAFCHSMVRSLMGAVVGVGLAGTNQGKVRRDVDWVTGLLAAGARDSSVTVMPASGLTLSEVGYPPDDQLAARAAQARSRRDEPQQQESE
ncbi:tRNA pseudouridine synthase A [Propionibacteriaceae bacterium G1746]